MRSTQRTECSSSRVSRRCRRAGLSSRHFGSTSCTARSDPKPRCQHHLIIIKSSNEVAAARLGQFHNVQRSQARERLEDTRGQRCQGIVMQVPAAEPQPWCQHHQHPTKTLQAATCSGRSGNFTTYRVVKLVSELKMPAGSDVKRFSCKSLPQNHSASTINQET